MTSPEKRDTGTQTDMRDTPELASERDAYEKAKQRRVAAVNGITSFVNENSDMLAPEVVEACVRVVQSQRDKLAISIAELDEDAAKAEAIIVEERRRTDIEWFKGFLSRRADAMEEQAEDAFELVRDLTHAVSPNEPPTLSPDTESAM